MRIFTPLILAPFILIGITIVLMTYINKRRKDYKNEVVYQVLSEVFEEFECGFQKGLSRERVYNTRLVRSGNRFKVMIISKLLIMALTLNFQMNTM